MPRSERFTVLDWAGIVVSAAAILALLTFTVVVAPTWRAMLSDFGSVLPVVTSLALTSWFAPTAAVPALAALVIAFVAPELSMPRRRLAVVVALAVACASAGFIVAALHLPTISMADALRS